MASESRSCGKESVGFFADLNCFTTADFCPQKKRKKQTVAGGYFIDVERMISNRNRKEVSLLCGTRRAVSVRSAAFVLHS